MQKGFFEPEYLKAIPSDNLEAVVYLSDEFDRFHKQVSIALGSDHHQEPRRVKFHEDYLEALAIFRAFTEARRVEIKLPDIGPHKMGNIIEILNNLGPLGNAWRTELSKRTSNSLYSEKTEHYTAIFNSIEVYEFNDADLKRIQILTNELMELISSSNLITTDHKRRLLKRLEGVQREIHKDTSDIDRFWGFIAEAGIVARKFGDDLKPISDRATELGRIVIAVVMAKEGIKALPDITKLLGQ
jgi:hypothetical protein